jgi:hypothetical protein
MRSARRIALVGTSVVLLGAVVVSAALTGPVRCRIAKLKAATRKIAGKMKCERKAIQHGTSVDPACLAKVEAKFGAAVAKADRPAPCPGGVGPIEDVVDGCVADLLGATGPTTTTSTTLTPASTTTTTLPCTSPGSDDIYVLDDANVLRRFDPRRLAAAQDPFSLIGTVACPAGPSVPAWPVPGPATPYSMAIDRAGTVWVLYSSGEIFRTSTASTASCTDSGYTPRQNGMDVFAMAFVTDTSGGDTEKLYLGGGDVNATPGGTLAVVDPTTLVATPVGTLPNQGESATVLTGTGTAELLGFYPGMATAFVQQVSKITGAAVGPQYSIPGGLGSPLDAWAFAQWGGSFFVFATVNGTSTLRVIDPATGQITTALASVPHVSVAAAVSTCAPSSLP